MLLVFVPLTFNYMLLEVGKRYINLYTYAAN
jgi:hypothetical protein